MTLEEVTHLGLVGRVLLEKGADTAQVQESVRPAAFGYEAHLVVTYEPLSPHGCLSWAGPVVYRVPAMNVNLAAVGNPDQESSRQAVVKRVFAEPLTHIKWSIALDLSWRLQNLPQAILEVIAIGRQRRRA